MDIFTTVLTRVVPVPIKSADLKVKAVLKDAAVGELKEDLDHVENHDYYFNNDNDKKKQKESEQNKQEKNSDGEQTKAATIEPETTPLKSKDKKHEDHADEGVTESKDGTKHLDLYV